MAGDEVRKTGKVQFAEVWMLSAVSNRKINFKNFKYEEVYYPTQQRSKGTWLQAWICQLLHHSTKDEDSFHVDSCISGLDPLMMLRWLLKFIFKSKLTLPRSILSLPTPSSPRRFVTMSP